MVQSPAPVVTLKYYGLGPYSVFLIVVDCPRLLLGEAYVDGLTNWTYDE